MAYKATARTRLKYEGKWYVPGDEVHFGSKAEAAAYGDAIEGGKMEAVSQAVGAPVGGPPVPPAARARAGTGRRAAGDTDTGGTDGGEEDEFEGVDFASPQAKMKAEELELTAESFKHQRKSSDNGFTVDDVERIASKTGE